MAGEPRLKITKYFGSSNVQQVDVSLAEAKSQLGYFFTKDGGSNIIVSVGGQTINSYDELVAVATQDKYKNTYVAVGLYLSNKGIKSIWPK